MQQKENADFSVEDDKEAVDLFATLATNEFTALKEKLKREQRKERLLYLRSLSRDKRKELKAKYRVS